MPKRVFWPVSLIVMGLVFLAASLGVLPRDFANLWPIILIVVGLGGLLTSDREEWLMEDKPAPKVEKSAPAAKSHKKTSRRSKKAK